MTNFRFLIIVPSFEEFKTAANPQGRLTKENVFIDVHRFLLVKHEASRRSPFLHDQATLRYTGTITKHRNTLYDIQ